MKLLIIAGISLLMAGSPAEAKTRHAGLKWMDGPPSLPSGVQMAVVSGDPGKKGMFTIQLKMPANYAVPPHSHPTNEVVKVLSGKLHYGMGDKLMGDAKTLNLAPFGDHESEDAPLGPRPGAGDRAGQRNGSVPDHLRRSEGDPRK